MAPLLSFMREQGVTIASYGTLSPILPGRVTDEALKPVLEKFKDTLDNLAQARGPSVSQNQILFKWLEAQQAIAVTTSSKESRLKENLATENLQDLTVEDMKAIEDAVGGTHYRAFAVSFAARLSFRVTYTHSCSNYSRLRTWTIIEEKCLCESSLSSIRLEFLTSW